MGFIAAGQMPQAEQNQAELQDELRPDAFWPLVSLSEFRALMRVDDNVTNPRAFFALETGLYDVFDQLKSLADQGAETLEQCYSIKQWPRMKNAFKQAVYNQAKSLILEDYRDVRTTPHGSDAADGLVERIDRCRVRVTESVRTLLGKSRVAVDLI